jgi:uncharacterized metal-binding protein
MAKGPTHAKYAAGTLALGSLLSALLALVGVIAWTLCGWVVWGLCCGLLMDGDLDQAQETESEKRIKDRFGPLIGGLWVAYWSPYAALFKHRSFGSHFPVFATAFRAFYAGIPFMAARAIFQPYSGPPTPLGIMEYAAWLVWPYSLPGLLAFLAGWAAQDTVHALLDVFEPKPKERRTAWDTVGNVLTGALVLVMVGVAAWVAWGL